MRLLYLYFDCPLDLSPDEGHYWDWSRHLDWSYYSKGPVVAYLIRASCAVFGEQMWAVRLPAILCGSLTLWGIFALTRRVYGNSRLSLGVVALALTLPAMAAGSLLMTIDAPYVCCWTWALVIAQSIFAASGGRQPPDDSPDSEPVAGNQGADAPRWPLWIVLGLLIGIGILAKYTMVLFIPSVALFLLTSTTHRRELMRPGFWIMVLTVAVCCLPILVWNAQHDWVTLRHVGRQAGVMTSENIAADPGFPTFRWIWPVEYLGGQIGLLLGFWFVAWLVVMVRTAGLSFGCHAFAANRGPSRNPETAGAAKACHASICKEDMRFLWWLSAPMFLMFLGFSFKTRIEVNWPITAYLSGMVLMAGWLSQSWRASRVTRFAIVGFALFGLAGTTLIHHTEWLYPLHDRLAPDTNPRRWDATCRLRGFQTLAAEVDRLRDELIATGDEPLIAGGNWNLPGILAFYLPEHPTVYSFGLAAGGRHSQYDFWRPNPTSDPADFRGKAVIYIGEVVPGVTAGFESVGPTQMVTHSVAGHAVATWPVTVLRGFKGFPRLHAAGH